MRRVSPPAVRRGGFTLVEAMVALAILATLLAVGMPRMADWAASTRAASAAQFYLEGLALARAQALAHNGASRLVLVPNAVSGQFDWRVDMCFPTPDDPCDDDGGDWSTPEDAVKPLQDAGDGVKSVLRRADALLDAARLNVSTGPDEASAVYFTSLGWVNTVVDTRMMRIDLAPAPDSGASFPATSIVLTLAGVATRCNPDAGEGDSRRCPA